jgi:hypothetical protein
MLDRATVEEFLDWELEEAGLEIPEDISMEDLVEAFFRYIDNDYYSWLKYNFKAFFNHGDPDWDGIRGKIGASEEY